ncbi:hypothetical protein CDV55_107202 [Aspergillus turcosus]|uniref:Transcription factor domain-containing protein n=1 Tax=Aspergillus turcosus TaxID=1245748 RepID=A0A229YYS4_9EURO|nr:hypothetical protein CDV55_107202 [Aspergillus turcosus]RLL97997.1 hypothetical protein CFD26_106322 [Aspergillus turcosus]
MHHFPFVIVPEGMDASVLWRESPFLLLCILTACLEHDPILQDKLEREIREIIGTRLILKMERNMDLLQGLLVHTAWYHYHWRAYHTQAYMLLQIAIMLVVDLGLDKDENLRMQAIPQDGKESHQVHEQGIHQTAAGQRALLGCYYLCSKLSIFRRQLTTRHTHWIDQCGRNLALRAEFPTDSNLMAYLDVQSLVRETQVILEVGLDYHSNSSCQEAWGRVFELMEKQRIEERLQGSNDNWALRFELSATNLLVLGHSLRRQKDVFYLHEMGQIQAITSSAHRIMTTFLNTPSTIAIHLPTTCYTILWYGLLALSKLSLLFPSPAAVALGVDNQTIHNVGIAIMQKIGSFSKGGDAWENSKNVIGSMLSWLEKSKPETQQTAPVQAGPMAPNDIGDCLSSDHTAITSSPRARGDAYIHQDAWPSIDIPSHLDPADYIEAQAAVDWDAGLWQGMLDSLTWSIMTAANKALHISNSIDDAAYSL